MRYPYNKGFTLLELVLVLFILGIGSSIAVVSIVRSYEKAALRNETRKLQGVLRAARASAVSERRPVTFLIDEKGKAFHLEKDDKPFGGRNDLPEGMSIEGKKIVFFPKGNSSGGKIVLSESKQSGYIIEVDAVTGDSKARRYKAGRDIS